MVYFFCSDAADPVIEVSNFGKKKFTKSFDDVGPNAQVYWGEHIFFEPKDLVKRSRFL